MTSARRAKQQRCVPGVVAWQQIMRQLAAAVPYHIPAKRW